MKINIKLELEDIIELKGLIQNPIRIEYENEDSEEREFRHRVFEALPSFDELLIMRKYDKVEGT